MVFLFFLYFFAKYCEKRVAYRCKASIESHLCEITVALEASKKARCKNSRRNFAYADAEKAVSVKDGYSAVSFDGFIL